MQGVKSTKELLKQFGVNKLSKLPYDPLLDFLIQHGNPSTEFLSFIAKMSPSPTTEVLILSARKVTPRIAAILANQTDSIETAKAILDYIIRGEKKLDPGDILTILAGKQLAAIMNMFKDMSHTFIRRVIFNCSINPVFLKDLICLFIRNNNRGYAWATVDHLLHYERLEDAIAIEIIETIILTNKVREEKQILQDLEKYFIANAQEELKTLLENTLLL